MEIVFDSLIGQSWTHINMEYVGKTKRNLWNTNWLCKELNDYTQTEGTHSTKHGSSTHGYASKKKAISQKLAVKGTETVGGQTSVAWGACAAQRWLCWLCEIVSHNVGNKGVW